MSADSSPVRSAQADELLAALQRSSICVSALAAAVVALTIAVERNTSAMNEPAEDDEDDEHDVDCDDMDCEGECLDDPEPPKRKRRKK